MCSGRLAHPCAILGLMASRTPKPKGPPTAERNIYFYRLNAGITPGGKPLAVDLAAALQEVHKLKYTPGSRRYWQQPDDNVICAWVDSAITNARFRLATVRRSGLPLMEDGGNLTALNMAATAGLYEPIHVCVFEAG